MYLPPKPRSGNQILAWAQKIHEYIVQITPRSSGSVKVKQSAGGTTLSEKPDYYTEPYHFEGIRDPDSTKIAIRGGLWERAARNLQSLPITVPSTMSPAPEFLAATGSGSLVTELSISQNTMSPSDVWIVYLGLWSDVFGDPGEDPVSGDGTELFADAVKGTIGSPPARPDDPEGDNALNWCKVLFTVTCDADGFLSFAPEVGNIKDFMMIPDGEPPWSSIIVDDRVESLDYVKTTAGGEERQKGLLQDRQAHELMVTADDVTQYANDYAFPYFRHDPEGVTQKFYVRADANDADSWSSPWGKTIQVGIGLGPEGGDVVQLYNADTMDDQTDNDKMVPYMKVDENDNHEIVYDWPVTIDSGTGGSPAELRPRNDGDGSDADTQVVTGITDSAADSYAEAQVFERKFNVSQAKLQIEEEDAGTGIKIEVVSIESSIIVWDEPLHHDETDPSPGSTPPGVYSQEDYKIQPSHDFRYFGVYDTYNATTFPGTSTGNYHTEGEIWADDFRLNDDDANSFWNHTAFRVDSDAAYIEAHDGTLTLTTSGANDVIVDSGGAVDIDGGDVDIDANGGNVTVQALAGGGLIGINADGDVTIESDNADVVIDAAVQASMIGGSVSISSDTGVITLDAHTDLELTAVGDFKYETVPGDSLADGANALFIKGGFVNTAPAWSIFAIRTIPAGGGAPIELNILGRAI